MAGITGVCRYFHRVSRPWDREAAGVGAFPISRAALQGELLMIYAVFMVLVLLTLLASWRRHVLELTLFCITVVCVLAYLIADMTTPLTLSF